MAIAMRIADGAKNAQTDDAGNDTDAEIAMMMAATGFSRLSHSRKQPEIHREYGKGSEDCSHPECLPNLEPWPLLGPER
jgi:hypothetical protein